MPNKSGLAGKINKGHYLPLESYELLIYSNTACGNGYEDGDDTYNDSIGSLFYSVDKYFQENSNLQEFNSVNVIYGDVAFIGVTNSPRILKGNSANPIRLRKKEKISS